MIFTAHADGRLLIEARSVRCALGRAGVVSAAAKVEGDGASPAGVWPLRRVLYRPDRGPRPETRLPIAPLFPNDGWCDAPGDRAYNRKVTVPYGARAERLWREDGLYDLLVVLAHNDAPVIPGAGSAIFLHIARPDYSPTDGCVALARADLETLMALSEPGDALAIVSFGLGS
ncbi:MAG: L,D-transpeptidase family protein [Caulobacteraceae bacterium]|nr:L,D-transpeptidase family protein [Caulobacteraceae bacterium]